MAIDVRSSLNRALKELHNERARIDRQIVALGNALTEVGGKIAARGRAAVKGRARRRSMSAAQKKAVSVRMRAYWAKRRAAKGSK